MMASGKGADLRGRFVKDSQKGVDGVRSKSHADEADQHGGEAFVNGSGKVGNDKRLFRQGKEMSSDGAGQTLRFPAARSEKLVQPLRLECMGRFGTKVYELPNDFIFHCRQALEEIHGRIIICSREGRNDGIHQERVYAVAADGRASRGRTPVESHVAAPEVGKCDVKETS